MFLYIIYYLFFLYLKNKLKKYNTYDLTGEYGIGYTFKGEEFWLDLEDYHKIKGYCWYYSQRYVVAHEIDDSKKHVNLHNLVMNKRENEVIDHTYHPKINENKYDNLTCDFCMAELPMSEKRKQEIEKKHKLEEKARRKN